MNPILRRLGRPTLAFATVSIAFSIWSPFGRSIGLVLACVLAAAPLLWWSVVERAATRAVSHGAIAGALTGLAGHGVPFLWLLLTRGQTGANELGAIGDVLSLLGMVATTLFVAVVDAVLGVWLVRMTLPPSRPSFRALR